MASFIAPIISGLAGLFGGGTQATVKSNSQSQQQGSQTQQGNTSQTSSVTPNLSPFQQQLAQLFTQGAGDLYNQSTNLQPYTTGGLQQIQQQGGANNQVLSNILAARGLSASPAAATALSGNVLNTGNQMNQFLQTVPLLQRQLQTQSLGQLIGAFGALPTGVTSQGDTSQFGKTDISQSGSMSGTNVQQGNPLGGLFSGIGAGLFGPSSGASNLSSIINMFKPSGSGVGSGLNV
jgi:hypothetical protein